MIERQTPEFQDRNPVLGLGLGVLALGARLDRLLAVQAEQPHPVASDDPLALALLGALSLRRTVRRHLAGASTDPVEPPEATSEPVEFLR